MSVVVVATFLPAPDRTEEVIKAVTAVIPAVHAEEGCELYALHRAKDRLMMIEKWSSRDALATHSRGAALAELGPNLKGLLTAPPEVVLLDAIPTGTDGQGVI